MRKYLTDCPKLFKVKVKTEASISETQAELSLNGNLKWGKCHEQLLVILIGGKVL